MARSARTPILEVKDDGGSVIQQLSPVPKKKGLIEEHHRFLMLGGGEIGIKILAALFGYQRFERFIHVVGVWPDWLNNSKVRYLRHYGEDEIPEARSNARLIKLAETLPRSNRDQPLPLCGRIIEQLRMFLYAEDLGFSPNQIIRSRYSDELLLKLIDFWKISGIIVGAFGGKISQAVRNHHRIMGRVWTCHPGPNFEGNLDYYPPEGRGKDVVDTIVAEPMCSEFIVAMLEIEDVFDSGKIVARTAESFAPYFLEHEMDPTNLSARVRLVLGEISTKYGDLVKYNLLRLLYKLSVLYPAFRDEPEKLIKMGFSPEKLARVARKFKKHKKKS